MDSGEIDEQWLLERIRMDDGQAFRALFDRYWLSLYKAAYKRLNDRQESEDMVQEVFASVWQRRGMLTLGPGNTLQAYLFTALRYRIISFYAGVRALRFQGEVLERLLLLQEEDHFSQLISRELEELIRKELQSMPGNMQKAWELTRQDRYSIKEVAVMLNLSEQTVKNLLTSSTRRLRACIEHYYKQGSPQFVILAVIVSVASSPEFTIW